MVVGIASIVDRTNGKSGIEYPLFPAIALNVQAFEKDDCPICKKGKIELVKPGSRKKF